MSKAFTRESDNEDDDEAQLPALPAGGKNYITPAGYARLRAEWMELIDNERPKVVEIVHWAASNGDRSENGDYLYGKKRLREIDRRIRFLTKRLEIAEVTDPACTMAATRSFSAPPSGMPMVPAWNAPSPSWASTRPTACRVRSAGWHRWRVPY